MSDAEKSVWLVFNGEIYNYKNCAPNWKAMAIYSARTRTPRSSSTDIRQWGTEVFNHLNGMFGVAIWDVKRRRLVVARDAMGIKLIYYRLADGNN